MITDMRSSGLIGALASVLLFGCASSNQAPEGPQPASSGAVESSSSPRSEGDGKTSSTGRGPDLVALPAGSFQMGSENGHPTEKPVHEVKVEAFELDQTEVTVAQYRTCVEEGACSKPKSSGGSYNYGKSEREQHPVNGVSSEQAEQFCVWSGKRLPTEEEWEYAARGTDGRTYPWGSLAPTASLARWNAKSTDPVGSHPEGASPFGILDLAGNVAEWTSSGSSNTYDQPRSKQFRVYRGGSWNNQTASFLRSALRLWFAPSYQGNVVGFRCARSK